MQCSLKRPWLWLWTFQQKIPVQNVNNNGNPVHIDKTFALSIETRTSTMWYVVLCFGVFIVSANVQEAYIYAFVWWTFFFSFSWRCSHVISVEFQFTSKRSLTEHTFEKNYQNKNCEQFFNQDLVCDGMPLKWVGYKFWPNNTKTAHKHTHTKRTNARNHSLCSYFKSRV